MGHFLKGLASFSAGTVLLAFLSAAPASASDPDGQSSAPVTNVAGGVTFSDSSETPKVEVERAECGNPPCRTGGIEVQAPVPRPDYTGSIIIWFDDTNSYRLPGPSDGVRVTFDTLYGMSGTSVPAADRNFGKGGNAIPAPGTGNYVIQSSVNATGFQMSEITKLYETAVDPITGALTEYYVGETRWEWSKVDYAYAVRTTTAPGVSTRQCVTFGEYRLNGAYDKTKTPMVPVSEGGTLTRDPRGDGKLNHIGKEISVESTLGASMGGDIAAKTGTPSPSAVFNSCVPTHTTNFDESTEEPISDLGRYEAPTQLWGSLVSYMSIGGLSEAEVARIYPSSVSRSKAAGWYKYQGGIAYILTSIAPVAPMRPFVSYYKIVCNDGTQANKRSEFVTVNAKSYDGWDAQPWGDAGVDYYSWDCSAGGGGGGGGGEVINTNTFLQCDRYGGGNNIKVVDGRPAAPLRNVSILVDDEIQNITADANGRYVIPSTADPVHTQWAPIRINTQDGTNIMSSPNVKNQQWEFVYKLGANNSPMLRKNVESNVNAPNQPYHGWVDSTPETVGSTELASGLGIKKWEPGKYYGYEVLSATYSYKDYTYTTKVDLSPYTYRSETRQTGSYSYPCGTYTYQSGTETYQCGGGYSVVSSGGATYYWWVNGGRGGWACPGGWWLSGTTCFTNTYIPPQYCSRPTFATGTNYCSAPTYGTFSVKNAPPAGWFDNGSQYQRNTQIKNPAPAGYTDNGISYQTTNPAPPGYSLQGDSYVSNNLKNLSGQMGGVEFDRFRPWVSQDTLSNCTINMSDYGITKSQSYTLKCGDNVTQNTRAAYFRFFQASNEGSAGWRVTPWAKVTADVYAAHTQVTGLRLQTDGTLVSSSVSANNWSRESFACPAEPVTFLVQRVASSS